MFAFAGYILAKALAGINNWQIVSEQRTRDNMKGVIGLWNEKGLKLLLFNNDSVIKNRIFNKDC